MPPSRHHPDPRWLWGIALVLGILAGACCNPSFWEDCSFRHLRTGDIIHVNHQVPHTDVLGVTPRPWVDFEWGFETTLSQLNHSGFATATYFCACLYALAVYWLWRACASVQDSRGYHISPMVCLMLTLVGFLTLAMESHVRPLLFTFFFMGFLVYRHHLNRPTNRSDWLLLPTIFLVWANVHSGWVAGLGYLGTSLVGVSLDRRQIQWRELGLVILCALVTLINPVGWQLLPHLLGILHSHYLYIWFESRPAYVYPFNWTGDVFLGLLGLLVLYCLFARPCWADILPVGIMALAAVQSQRQVLLFTLAVLPIMAKALASRREEHDSAESALSRDQSCLTLGMLLILASCPWWPKLTPQLNTQTLNAPHIAFPIELIGLMEGAAERFHNPITTCYSSGAFVWLCPWLKNTFDDRGDLYGDKEVDTQLDLENTRGDWLNTLRERHYDSALIESNLPLNPALEKLGWTKVYDDGHLAVYWNLK